MTMFHVAVMAAAAATANAAKTHATKTEVDSQQKYSLPVDSTSIRRLLVFGKMRLFGHHDIYDVFAGSDGCDYWFGLVFGCALLWISILVATVGLAASINRYSDRKKACPTNGNNRWPWRRSQRVPVDNAATLAAQQPIASLSPTSATTGTATSQGYDDDDDVGEKKHGSPNENNAKPHVDNGDDAAFFQVSAFGTSNDEALRRAMLVVCCLVNFAFTIVFVIKGLSLAQSTVEVVHSSSLGLGWLLQRTRQLIELHLAPMLVSVKLVRGGIEQQLRDANTTSYCRNDVNLTIGGTALSASVVADQIQQQAGTIREYLVSLDERLEELNVFDLLQQIDMAAAINVNLQHHMASIQFTDFYKLFMYIPFAIMPIVVLAGSCILTKPVVNEISTDERDFSANSKTCNTGKYFYRNRVAVHKCVTLSVFGILVALYWVMMLALMVAAGVNSDFCVPSGAMTDGDNIDPEETILRSMLLHGQGRDSMSYNAINYYTSLCTDGTSPLDFLPGLIPILAEAQLALKQLVPMVWAEASFHEMALYCNNPDLSSSLEDLVLSLQHLVDASLIVTAKALDLGSCRRIVPLYVQTVHDGACNLLPLALFWILSSILIMAVTGLIAIVVIPRPALSSGDPPESTAPMTDEIISSRRFEIATRFDNIITATGNDDGGCERSTKTWGAEIEETIHRVDNDLTSLRDNEFVSNDRGSGSHMRPNSAGRGVCRCMHG